jgi:ketosteroid isomerase-like protein
VDRDQLADWIERYESAWRAPGTESLTGLFREDATYFPSPYAEPQRGLDAIRKMWESERTPGEEFTMATEVIATNGDVGVVRVRVDYAKPQRQQYRDLWVIRLDERGRCTAFEEWPFWPPGTEGSAAAGG